MLSAAGIYKSFTNESGTLEILRGVDLQLWPADSAAIVGPSGSGKSTLLNILGTLEPPTSGTVELAGQDLAALPEHELARVRNQDIGFVFQDHHLLSQCSVLENVLIPTLAGYGGERRDERAHELLGRVGLGQRLKHRPAELSGGEKQRVALARALINSPKLVLADEPTGNLDRATAEQVGDLLAELPETYEVMLLVVTHSPALAERFKRRYALREGRLQAQE
jgi:lipoprotein-releasing system ATP-binding protein